MSYDNQLKVSEELMDSSPLFRGIQDKFRTVLNHVKYGWTVQIKPSFNPDSLVYFLGKEYKESGEGEVSPYLSLEDFSDNFASCLWFTYRANFEPISRLGLDETSPCFKLNFDNLTIANQTDKGINIREDCEDTILVEAIDYSSRPITTSKSFSTFSSSVPMSTPEASSSMDNPKTQKLRSKSELNGLNSEGDFAGGTLRTSDCGWGCMLRSAQMLLAHCILKHIMGDDYRAYVRNRLVLNREKETYYRQIIKLFGDSLKYPFSIHKFLLLSAKQPGTWFGPTTAANLMVNALISAKCEKNIFFEDLEIYIANDRVVIREQLFALAKQNYAKACEFDSKHFYSIKHTAQINCPCKTKVSSGKDASVLLLISMKLGCGQKIDVKIYGESLKRMMKDPCFVGLLGGKPNRSVFIAGYQDNKYIFFEPHIKQQCVDVSKDNFPLKSFSCFVPQMGRFERLDSSTMIGFLVRSINEMNQLFHRLRDMNPKIFEVISVKERSISKKESTVSAISEISGEDWAI